MTTSKSNTPGGEYLPGTLDIVFPEAKAKMRQQEERSAALDTKAYALLAAAGAVTFAPALRIAEMPNLPATALLAFALAVAVFVWLALTLRSALVLRDFYFPPTMKDLTKPATLLFDPDGIRLKMLDLFADAYPKNEQLLRDKAAFVERAVTLVLVEAAVIVIGLFLVRLAGP